VFLADSRSRASSEGAAWAWSTGPTSVLSTGRWPSRSSPRDFALTRSSSSDSGEKLKSSRQGGGLRVRRSSGRENGGQHVRRSESGWRLLGERSSNIVQFQGGRLLLGRYEDLRDHPVRYQGVRFPETVEVAYGDKGAKRPRVNPVPLFRQAATPAERAKLIKAAPQEVHTHELHPGRQAPRYRDAAW
jgi:hypothetical protein